jgi:hypothetical protein
MLNKKNCVLERKLKQSADESIELYKRLQKCKSILGIE